MKTVIKLGAFVLLTFVLITSCTKEGPMGPQGEQGIQGEKGPKGDSGQDGEDAQTEIPQAYGRWETIEGNLGAGDSEYVYINEDNTINILSEDYLGFKRVVKSNIVVTTNQIIFDGIFNYVVNEDILTITLPYSEDPVQLQRTDSGPEVSVFVKQMEVLDQGTMSWNQYIDIAFDGTYILGWDNNLSAILKIDPIDFSVADQIPTGLYAESIEMEKSDDPTRQIFQSNGSDRSFQSFIYTTNNYYYTSETIGSGIAGLASIEPGLLWVSRSFNRTLHKYKSNGSLTPGEILETVSLEIQPEGLDYLDGFLYITDGIYVHKCQTSPEFKAVETFQLINHSISGIAFDGNNFWVAARDWEDNEYKLLKTDMGL